MFEPDQAAARLARVVIDQHILAIVAGEVSDDHSFEPVGLEKRMGLPLHALDHAARMPQHVAEKYLAVESVKRRIDLEKQHPRIAQHLRDIRDPEAGRNFVNGMSASKMKTSPAKMWTRGCCYLLLLLIWKRQLDLLVLEPEAIDSKRYR
jgi:hypothetical protein